MTDIDSTWQIALSKAITSLPDLLERLNIHNTSIEATKTSFPLRVPLEFVSRMEVGNHKDPLLLQVLPQAIETVQQPFFSTDPLKEQQKNPIPGLLHKYPHRVLLTLTGGCAVNCRYCFRRHFPYAENLPGRSNWKQTIEYIKADSAIEEVIFSGGDPLILKDHLIAEFVDELENIPHLLRLRIHTRLPIVIPQRVTAEWIDWMKKTRFQMIVVLHCNHPNEIDDHVISALQLLKTAPITLLNQAVLLKNVNDNADVLVNLSKRLFQAGVLPYYLHLLDKVEGAAHFDVNEETAYLLMADIKKRLPGFLVPKLAREVPGMLHKDY